MLRQTVLKELMELLRDEVLHVKGAAIQSLASLPTLLTAGLFFGFLLICPFLFSWDYFAEHFSVSI